MSKRVKLNIFPSRLDINLNDSIAASKRRYIQPKLRSMNADSHDPLKNFDLTHKLNDRAEQEIDRSSKVFAKAECNEGYHTILRADDFTREFVAISEH